MPTFLPKGCRGSEETEILSASLILRSLPTVDYSFYFIFLFIISILLGL